MIVTAVVMAGGKGERFWPKSRNDFPKQFLSLTLDGKTMIQKTVERLSALVKAEDVFVVTNKSYESLVREQLPEIPQENVLYEPVGRNTAPCIGLAASVIEKKYGDAVMMVLPSDHLIKDDDLYTDTFKRGINIVSEGENLVTIGIKPEYPETGYGYIRFEGDDSLGAGVYRVEKFEEKPTLVIAEEYVNSGNYLWNSGMFIWRSSTILNNINKFIPEYTDGLNRIKNAYGSLEFDDVLNSVFPAFRSESVDYGIMEKASNIFTIPGLFGWDDVGNWLALERFNEADGNNNVIQGDIISIDSHNNIVVGGDKLVAAVGVENLIIVQTDDAVLVCSKNNTQNVKKVVEILKSNNRKDLI